LIEFFAARPDSTVIAVLGDHLPPLSSGALAGFYRDMASVPAAERDWWMRRVPLLVWSNFPLRRERPMLSANALPSYLLEKMGIRGSSILALTGTLRHELPVFAPHAGAPGGKVWRLDSLPPRFQTVLEDYRLMQYDQLLGKQYTSPESLTTWRNAEPSN
jgi:hypothetical protein